MFCAAGRSQRQRPEWDYEKAMTPPKSDLQPLRTASSLIAGRAAERLVQVGHDLADDTRSDGYETLVEVATHAGAYAGTGFCDKAEATPRPPTAFSFRLKQGSMCVRYFFFDQLSQKFVLTYWALFLS